MGYPRISSRMRWIAAGLAIAIPLSLVVVVSVNEKAQSLFRWLPHVTIDHKARKITLGINLSAPYKPLDLPKAKPMNDDVQFLAVPPTHP